MNIWAAIYGDTPEALIKGTKSRILIRILTKQRKDNLSKKKIAAATGMNRSRVKALLLGYMGGFTIEEMLTVARQIGAMSANDPIFSLQVGSK